MRPATYRMRLGATVGWPSATVRRSSVAPVRGTAVRSRVSLRDESRARNVRHRPAPGRADGVAVRVRFRHIRLMSRKSANSRPSGPVPSKSTSSGDTAPPRYALPTDLGASLKHLDDAQFDALLSAVAAEARCRGRIGAFRGEESARGWLADGVQGERPAGFVAAGSGENHPGRVRSRRQAGPYPAEAMSVHPVSTLVNRPANDDPRCIETLADR